MSVDHAPLEPEYDCLTEDERRTARCVFQGITASAA
jgi:hypothetical protein